MKMRLILCLTLGLLSGLCVAQTPFASFDFNACSLSDAQGNINSTTLGNSPDCVCGVDDTGWRLTPGQFISLDEGIRSLFGGSFTMSFYFSPRSNTDQVVMLSGSDCRTDSSLTISYLTGPHQIEIFYQQDDIFFVREVIPLRDDQCWHHIAVSKSETDFQFYLDGILQFEVRGIIIDFARDNFLRIGGVTCTSLGLQAMDGAIDELRLYRGVLSPVELRQLFIDTDFLQFNDAVALEGETVQARVINSCATDFSWTPAIDIDNPDTSDAVFTVVEDREYVLRMSQDGCESLDTFRIIVVDSSALDCDRLFLATAFTPNGDLLNDQFGISNPFLIDELVSFKINDRLGETLFVTTDPRATWDGSYKGIALNAGVYIYEIVYFCDGEEKQLVGTVMLMR